MNAGRPTFAQRARIIELLARHEFDTRTVTYAYRRLGVSEDRIGRPVDTWLDSISIEQASNLIGKLEDI
jgi:hypothetical protein